MPSTGEKCRQAGDYECANHPERKVFLIKGETFPPCPEAEHETIWIYAIRKKVKNRVKMRSVGF
jgi:hypothetical protein